MHVRTTISQFIFEHYINSVEYYVNFHSLWIIQVYVIVIIWIINYAVRHPQGEPDMVSHHYECKQHAPPWYSVIDDRWSKLARYVGLSVNFPIYTISIYNRLTIKQWDGKIFVTSVFRIKVKIFCWGASSYYFIKKHRFLNPFPPTFSIILWYSFSLPPPPPCNHPLQCHGVYKSQKKGCNKYSPGYTKKILLKLVESASFSLFLIIILILFTYRLSSTY